MLERSNQKKDCVKIRMEKESRHCKALNEDKHYAREEAEITEKERKRIEKPRTILDENEMN